MYPRGGVKDLGGIKNHTLSKAAQLVVSRAKNPVMCGGELYDREGSWLQPLFVRRISRGRAEVIGFEIPPGHQGLATRDEILEAGASWKIDDSQLLTREQWDRQVQEAKVVSEIESEKQLRALYFRERFLLSPSGRQYAELGHRMELEWCRQQREAELAESPDHEAIIRESYDSHIANLEEMLARKGGK